MNIIFDFRNTVHTRKCSFIEFFQWVIVILCLFIPGILFSQTLSPTVFATGGDYFESEEYSLSITVGEPVTDTYFSSGNVLNCGFQQVEPPDSYYMVWTGVIDNDWNKSGNWNFTRVPLSTDDVLIPASAINMPVVNISGRSCRNIVIEQNASVTVNPGVDFTVYGDVTMY